jgi:hypothetical protein
MAAGFLCNCGDAGSLIHYLDAGKMARLSELDSKYAIQALKLRHRSRGAKYIVEYLSPFLSRHAREAAPFDTIDGAAFFMPDRAWRRGLPAILQDV